MPTDEEWTELRTKCTWTWTKLNGVNGYNVTAPNGNSIFLPAAGDRLDTALANAGRNGEYWSSSLSTDYPHHAWHVDFYSANVNRFNTNRYYGYSVRPVYELSELEKRIKELEEDSVFEAGSGENSVQQKGSNAVAFGVNSTAFGTSTTNAKDRGITEESTSEEIIQEWAASDPEDQKFALTLGEGSHIEGNNCLALGKNSHAEGNGTVAGNNSSHAEGTGAKAIGKYAHAEGLETIAEGNGSHTEGKETHTSGNTSDYSHAEGDNTAVEVRAGHAEGYKSIAARSGYSENTLTPHAQGTGTSGWVNGISHAEGNATIAQGLGAHAEGEKTFANGRTAHAEGLETVASGNYASHAEGEATIASGEDSHAEGFKTKAAALASHAEGNRTVINEGGRSHTEGYGTYAKGVGAHSEGINGYYIVLQRNGSSGNVYNIKQIEGMTPADALAAGKYPKVGDLNAEDSKTVKSVDTTNHTITMSGNWGGNNKWSRLYFIINDIEDTSLRENDGALGFAAHAEGVHTKANGFGSHTEGEMTVANGDTSHAEGWRTKTENQCEHAQGQYNVSHKASGTFGDAGNTIHSVGIGNRTDNYGNGDNKNAFEIMQNGDAYLLGVGNYDGTNPGEATPINQLIGQGGGSTLKITGTYNDNDNEFICTSGHSIDNIKDALLAGTLVVVDATNSDNQRYITSDISVLNDGGIWYAHSRTFANGLIDSWVVQS